MMGLHPETIFRPMGDRGLLLEFGDRISREANEKVRRMVLALERKTLGGIVETVPAYSSLLVIYDPLLLSVASLKQILREVEAGLEQIGFPPPKQHRVPVVYGGAYGPDLEEVARYHRIPPGEVVRLHCSVLYLVYMIGFMPGYPYMGELPEELNTPRLKTPRLLVPAGSVAIAQRQTGIYPVESPGGWRVIGRTPEKLFDSQKDPPVLLQMGDRVRFHPISEKEVEVWRR